MTGIARTKWQGLIPVSAEAAPDITGAFPAVTALGIDPGPAPGFFLGTWVPGQQKAAMALAWQCDAGKAPGLLAVILSEYEGEITCGQIEEFRTGYGPGTRGKSASVTRNMVLSLAALADERGVKLAVRHSSQAFPWASDKRLKEAGLYKVTAGKQHARAASRHCLYAACHDGGLPDPLSKKG